jgi:hypothetical protein
MTGSTEGFDCDQGGGRPTHLWPARVIASVGHDRRLDMGRQQLQL